MEGGFKFISHVCLLLPSAISVGAVSERSEMMSVSTTGANFFMVSIWAKKGHFLAVFSVSSTTQSKERMGERGGGEKIYK